MTINRRDFLKTLGVGAVSMSLLPAISFAQETSKPNILFIVSEDNSEQLGCYGEKRVHTPALDSLAETGVRFTRAYVPYSVCSPSRAAFLTGLYTRQNGHIGLATHNFAMYKDFKTMPAYFKDAGYYTGFLGKTHINPERVVEDHIDHRAIVNSNFAKTISIEKYAEEAKTVMQNAAKEKKPFLLIINYADAHRKFIEVSKSGFPTVKVKGEIEPLPWIGSDTPLLRKEMKNYYSCMNRLDEGVGMVLKNLDEMKVRENTLIVYISDHGADFPRSKTSVYEPAIKVPMIVNYPKAFPAGKVEDRLVSTVDILPTMLTSSRIPVPGSLSGMPLQKLNEKSVKWRKYIYSFTTGSAPGLLFVQFGITGERYKLVYNPSRDLNLSAVSRYKNSKIPAKDQLKSYLNPPEFELFDLEKDPYEFNNLAGKSEYKEVQTRLLNEMKAFQKKIKDPFADKENVKKLIAEQKKYKDRSEDYKKEGFRWSHLDMFEK
ncbi:sulfatase [Verrucomicrobiota bacterium]